MTTLVGPGRFFFSYSEFGEDPATVSPDPHQLPERAQPGQQCGVTGRGGRELTMPQQPARRAERRGGVGVFVRVDPTGDLDVGLLAGGGGYVIVGMSSRLSIRKWGGTHQPGER